MASFVVMTILFLSSARLYRIAGQEKMTLYVSTGCPHCAKVELFINKNEIEESFEIRNVTTDLDAAADLTELFEKSELPLNEQGTPALEYDDGQLVTGDVPIMELLSEKYDIDYDPEEYEDEGEAADNDDDSNNNNTQLSTGDYVILIAGAVIVSFVVGYGIVKVVNERRKS